MAESLAKEAAAVNEATRKPDIAPYGALVLAAWRGRKPRLPS